MSIGPTKTCFTCKTNKQVSEFNRDRYKSDGLQGNCKACAKIIRDANFGMSLDDFKIYFESKFTEGMSWDRFLSGEIHIDHIRPCASFNLAKPEEQGLCFHYSNLQPLWAKDNLAKRDRLDWKAAV